MARSDPVLQSGGVVSFQMEGLDELIETLESLGKQASGVLFDATMAGGRVIAAEANRLGPGRDGVIVEPEKDGIQPGSITVAIGPDFDHWYWLFFETGASRHEISPESRSALDLAIGSSEDLVSYVANHPGIPARPFLRPALDTKQAEVFAAIGKTIMAAMEKK